MSHPQHLDGSVDKSNSFIETGMTLITEVDSEKYLKKAKEQRAREHKIQEVRDRWS
tara:strand:- start:75 stop:242 length:168 start_codon:yes stop_codon:yes gene_type:complete